MGLLDGDDVLGLGVKGFEEFFLLTSIGFITGELKDLELSVTLWLI